jgi:transcriptional regulator with XRE-family HTH domain
MATSQVGLGHGGAATLNDDSGGPTYARQVGDRLRSIRRQQRLSLHEVETMSRQEFKASVMGAYERGERIISVARLHRLARLYRVPVDQLLPSESNGDGANGGGSEAGDGHLADGRVRTDGGITFDLTRFNEIDDPQLAMVQRYLDHIALRRQDFNGRVLTIRGDDVRAMAGLFGTDADQLVRRLEDFRLRVRL